MEQNRQLTLIFIKKDKTPYITLAKFKIVVPDYRSCVDFLFLKGCSRCIFNELRLILKLFLTFLFIIFQRFNQIFEIDNDQK